jgi:hypothetical protein
MRETGTSRRDRALAATCVLLLHAGLGWGLHRLLRVEPALAEPEALQVVWITPRAVSPIAAPTVTRRPVRVVPSAKPLAAVPLDAPSTPAPPANRPLSVVALAQARQWARQQAPLAFAGADALADRTVALPGRPADRFRMTASLTPADVVAAIGAAFGGAGEDPCVRNRQNLAGYATGRDATALALELDFERRHCRP